MPLMVDDRGRYYHSNDPRRTRRFQPNPRSSPPVDLDGDDLFYTALLDDEDALLPAPDHVAVPRPPLGEVRMLDADIAANAADAPPPVQAEPEMVIDLSSDRPTMTLSGFNQPLNAQPPLRDWIRTARCECGVHFSVDYDSAQARHVVQHGFLTITINDSDIIGAIRDAYDGNFFTVWDNGARVTATEANPMGYVAWKISRKIENIHVMLRRAWEGAYRMSDPAMLSCRQELTLDPPSPGEQVSTQRFYIDKLQDVMEELRELAAQPRFSYGDVTRMAAKFNNWMQRNEELTSQRGYLRTNTAERRAAFITRCKEMFEGGVRAMGTRASQFEESTSFRTQSLLPLPMWLTLSDHVLGYTRRSAAWYERLM